MTSQVAAAPIFQEKRPFQVQLPYSMDALPKVAGASELEAYLTAQNVPNYIIKGALDLVFYNSEQFSRINNPYEIVSRFCDSKDFERYLYEKAPTCVRTVVGQ